MGSIELKNGERFFPLYAFKLWKEENEEYKFLLKVDRREDEILSYGKSKIAVLNTKTFNLSLKDRKNSDHYIHKGVLPRCTELIQSPEHSTDSILIEKETGKIFFSHLTLLPPVGSSGSLKGILIPFSDHVSIKCLEQITESHFLIYYEDVFNHLIKIEVLRTNQEIHLRARIEGRKKIRLTFQTKSINGWNDIKITGLYYQDRPVRYGVHFNKHFHSIENELTLSLKLSRRSV